LHPQKLHHASRNVIPNHIRRTNKGSFSHNYVVSLKVDIPELCHAKNNEDRAKNNNWILLDLNQAVSTTKLRPLQ